MFIHLICFFILWVSLLQEFFMKVLFLPWIFCGTLSNLGASDILSFSLYFFFRKLLIINLYKFFEKIIARIIWQWSLYCMIKSLSILLKRVLKCSVLALLMSCFIIIFLICDCSKVFSRQMTGKWSLTSVFYKTIM